MRAMTVRQPWAWAIIHGGKDVENRTRNIAGAYRGPLAIHAGLTEAPLADWTPHLHGAMADVLKDSGDVVRDVLGARGVVIGVVDLVDVHEATPPEVEWCGCSAWAERYHVHHLVLANRRPLAEPIPWRGALGLWRVPTELEQTIREQVSA